MTSWRNNRAARLDMVALTISPPDVKYLTIDKLWLHHKRLLSKIKSKFVLYPELDKTGRLHYHGYIHKEISLKEDLEYIKKLGFVKVKDIFDLGEWVKYCSKEWKFTKKMKNISGCYIWKKPINNDDCVIVMTSYDITTYFS